MATTLSEYIRSDLKRRLVAGQGPPAGLTLDALARHYGVSHTPVRRALRSLVAEGVLWRGGGGRIGVGPSAGGGRLAWGLSRFNTGRTLQGG